MKNSPLVSVIIPTYNRANLLPNTIESVLGQSHANTEIIIVDDGSTDNTQQVLEHYADRLRIVTQENKGASAARNYGIRIAKGDIIAFLDSDDLWLPTKLERQVALLDKIDPKIPCCLCNIRLAYADGRIDSSFNLSWIKPSIEEGLWVNVLEVLATRFILFNQAIVIRREALDKIGGFDENYKYMEDHDLALRLALLGSWAFIQEPLVIWNEGTVDSLTKQATTQKAVVSKTIFEMYQKIVILAEDHNVPEKRLQQLKFELIKRRLRYKADQISLLPSFWSRMFGNSLRKLERYFDMVYWYLPWYPKMEVKLIATIESSKTIN